MNRHSNTKPSSPPLFNDEETAELLTDFAKRYYKATHPLELTKMGVSGSGDIILTIILIIFTAGVGAAANTAIKVKRLEKVASILSKLSKILRRIGPRHRLPKLSKKGGASAKNDAKSATKKKKGIPDIDSPKKKSDLVDGDGKKRYGDGTDGDVPKKIPEKVTPNRDRLSDLTKAELDQVKKVSTFKPLGVSNKNAKQFLLNSDEGKELLRLTKESAGPDASIDEVIDRAIGYVQTGKDLPKIQHVDRPLVKIVTKGQGVSDYSPFFTTMDDLKAAQKSNRPLSDMFGLPAASDSPAYDVFQIEPKSGAIVFMSKIAPTQELGGKLTTRGGANQIIIPNRKQFSSPERLFSITDNIR